MSSLAPTTTAQQDLTTLGQRKVNLIWECTQACIALLVVISNMYAALFVVANPNNTVLSNSLFLIVGFYFSRTNHSAIGGIGLKPSEEYKGR
jgi:hypothetical protein